MHVKLGLLRGFEGYETAVPTVGTGARGDSGQVEQEMKGLSRCSVVDSSGMRVMVRREKETLCSSLRI